MTASVAETVQAGQPPIDRAPVYALLSANAISAIGNMLTTITIPWLVLEMTGSAVRTGISGIFAGLPLTIVGIIGGTLVDRFGFRRMSIAAGIASGVTVAAIPLLHLTIALDVSVLVTLIALFAMGVAIGPISPLVMTIMDERVSAAFRGRVFGAMTALTNVSIRLGIVLAGFAIALLGLRTTVLILAVAYLAMAVASMITPAFRDL